MGKKFYHWLGPCETVATGCLFMAYALYIGGYLLTTSWSIFSYFVLPTVILLFLAFLTGFISLVTNCRFQNGPIKISCSVLIVLISALTIPVGIIGEIYASARARKNTFKVEYLHKVGSNLLKYAQNNNDKLPLSEEWCDVLTQYNPEVTSLLLKRPKNGESKSKGECHFAFNKNLSGRDINNISPNVILVFEAEGKWNLNGTSELLMSHRNRVFLMDGSIRLHAGERKFLRDFSIKHTFKKFLWE